MAEPADMTAAVPMAKTHDYEFGPCESCEGKGFQSTVRVDPTGHRQAVSSRPCSDCRGSGRIAQEVKRPLVTTLCGSTRFPDAFALANMHLSLQGRIVIGLGMQGHADDPRGARFLTSDGDESKPEKRGLDVLHFRKIDLSDTIYVVNVGGYVGSSTRREIAYAESQGKTVEWMFPVVREVENDE